MPSAAKTLFAFLLLLLLPVVAAASVPAPTFVLSWGNSGSASGQFNSPIGVTTDNAGNVYVADVGNHRIQKFSSTGYFLGQWDALTIGDGQIFTPAALTLGANDHVYVADDVRDRVLRFTTDGTFVDQWGSHGAGNGEFVAPRGLAVDSNGDVYVLDIGNSRIQKLSSEGVFNSQWRLTGATTEQFTDPRALTIDRYDNVYVTDGTLNRVEKFTSGGKYLMGWGGTGTALDQFDGAAGVSADAVGNIYVADRNNHRVLRFDGMGSPLGPAFGTLGTGNGQFQDGDALAVDAAGDVYVADIALSRIQRFSGAGVTLSEAPPTFLLKWGTLGDCSAVPNPAYAAAATADSVGQFTPPFGLANDTDGNIFVADAWRNMVQKFTPTGTLLARWGTAGTGTGQFNLPCGVATDSVGNVYIADKGNHRIQKFTGTGTYLTQWGAADTSDGQFMEPSGITMDAAGDLYVADTHNSCIQKFNSDGHLLTRWGSFGSGNRQFNRATSLAVDSLGYVYVADAGNHRIQKFTSSGTFIMQWGSYGSGIGQFKDTISVFIMRGRSHGSEVGRYKATPGTCIDYTNRISIVDDGNKRILLYHMLSGDSVEYEAAVSYWGMFGMSPEGAAANLAAIAADAALSDYLCALVIFPGVTCGFQGLPPCPTTPDPFDYFLGQAVRGVNAPPSPPDCLDWPSLFAATPSYGKFCSPSGVATDADGFVYVSDDAGPIQKFTSTGGNLTKWGGSGEGVATDHFGFVYEADALGNRIRKFTSTGTFVSQWGSLGYGNGNFNKPAGVATDAAGNVYVADTRNHRVQKFTSTGDYICKWGDHGSGAGDFDYPEDLATDAAGNVFVVDAGNRRIQKFTSTGIYLTQWGSHGSGDGQFHAPSGVATNAVGDVYVSDVLLARVQKFTGTGVYLTQWGSYGSHDGQFMGPNGLATDAAGNIYVADSSSGRVQKFAASPAIAFGSDVPNDQGGRVKLRIRRTSADSPGSGTLVSGYDVYRLGTSAEVFIPATGAVEYSVEIGTIVNATAASLEYSTFFVSARTAPGTALGSGPAYGYSVDNLAPPAPTPFTAAYISGATHLAWGVNPASDFATFKLYRGLSADFLPGPDNLILESSSTGYVDVGPAGRFYQLSATDTHGNEGRYAAAFSTSSDGVAFTDIAAGLTGVYSSSLAWGDYDNDGDLDLLLTGYTGTGPIAKIYRNSGGANPTFTDINAGLPGVNWPSVAWGDYDNDGDLDILLAGLADIGPAFYTIFRNSGGANPTFTDIEAGIVGSGPFAWGDYDNDGDLDIAAGSKIYRNSGGANPTFTDIAAGLPWLRADAGSVAWADYDNDGNLDLMLAGYTGSEYIATLYRNSGGDNPTFTDIGAGFPGTIGRTVAWGDYDNDGELDLLLTGIVVGPGIAPESRIYRNSGGEHPGTFTDIAAGLPRVWDASAAWGDYDNDGNLDLLISGSTYPYVISRIYRNSGGVSPTFTDIAAGLPGVSPSCVAWGDYDNDGDLDIVLAGSTGSEYIAKIYRSTGSPANVPPQAPTNLSTWWRQETGEMEFFWTASDDDHTPARGLNYNLRIGTTPGGDQLSAAMAAADGFRRVVRLGNGHGRNYLSLKLPPNANYYWGVQAIDGAFLGSPFALDSWTVGVENTPPLPTAYAIQSAAPNPAVAGTAISYALPRSGPVELAMFDLVGRRVRVLDQGDKPAGSHVIRWDGRNDGGTLLANGMYVIRLTAGGGSWTRKLVLLR